MFTALINTWSAEVARAQCLHRPKPTMLPAWWNICWVRAAAIFTGSPADHRRKYSVSWTPFSYRHDRGGTSLCLR